MTPRAAAIPGRRRARRNGANPIDLSGKVAVITGAGSGIGRATALRIAGLGAKVHVTDLDSGAASGVAEEIVSAGGNAEARGVDVSDPEAVGALADAVFSNDGAVDVLHNNAGIGHGGGVEDTPLEDWQRIVGVNLMGTVHGVHFFVPRMLRQGRPGHVVNTASMLGLVASAQLAPYCTSKFGVVGLSQALNAELSPRGVQVTALCPGIIDTPIVGAALARGEQAARIETTRDFYRRRGASPEVVAEAVIDAIRDPRPIQTVPRRHVEPLWFLERLSPRLGQAVARRLPDLVTGGS